VKRRLLLGAAALVTAFFASLAPATAAPTVTESFPEDFPEIIDASLNKPVIGFGGSEGPVTRTPVILLHGNNDTPFPTPCNGGFGHMKKLGQYLLDNGYAPQEVWALGYQGDQCDLLTSPTNKSAEAHSAAANVPDLRAFVDAVLDYTGAEQVDIVGHSLGGIVPREWMRQDQAYDKVRRLVAIDSPHYGIINCSPNPLNYYALDGGGGFNPDSAICVEFGAHDTTLLAALDAEGTPGPTEYLSIFNEDVSFVYIPEQDGAFAPVPAENRRGEPHDFSKSAILPGEPSIGMTGQGIYDTALLTAHIGISASPDVHAHVLSFLTAADPASVAAAANDSVAASQQETPEGELPATGWAGSPVPWATAAGVSLLTLRTLGKTRRERNGSGRARSRTAS
jgi:pimeloyl-ACP methyl ester carboxylesterase